MARSTSYVLAKLTRGLNLVRPPSLLDPGQCQKAENVVFTSSSVKRRLGKLIAYERPTASANPITLLKRFYNLASTGTIEKRFLIVFGTNLWYATTDWSDATETQISSFTQLVLPNDTSDTLYLGYGGTLLTTPLAITLVAGTLKHSFASKSWLYLYPDYSSTDDFTRTGQVPMRTKLGLPTAPVADENYGTNTLYLHGLVPPLPLVQADTTDYKDIAGVYTRLAADAPLAGIGIQGFGTAIDKDGNTHITYVDATGGQTLVYLFYNKSTGTFTREVVDTANTPTIFNPSCIALDSLGNIWIAYYDNTAFDIRVASKLKDAVTASWQLQTVDTAGILTEPAMTIDSVDVVHIAYKDATTPSIKYASGRNTWTIETIATPEDVAGFGSIDIAVSSANVPHVSWANTATGDIRYSNRSGAPWLAVENVDTTPTAGNGLDTSIDLNSANVPAVVWFDGTGTTDAVKYRTRAGGTWGANSIETIEASLGVNGGRPHMKFDSGDVPHVAYRKLTNTLYDLKLANRKTGTSTWNTTVAHTGSNFDDPGIAIDANGNPVLSYSEDGLASKPSARFLTGRPAKYHYILTAEYDKGILGESGPSAAFTVLLDHEITATTTSTLKLDTGTAGRYDMTKEVTNLFVYRTVENADIASTYYRVGTQAVTNSTGNPSSDFIDAVPDSILVTNRILDKDKFLPPKYKTATIWKDRCVIGNLKTRKRDAPTGTELDLEATGIHKNRIRFSRAFQPDIYPVNYFLDILPDGDSGSIQRLIVSPRIDALLVFMEADTVAVIGDSPLGEIGTVFRPRNIAQSKGTPAPDSVIEANGLIFYWTKEGIEVINGFEARNITSEVIGNLWNNLNVLDPSYADRVNMAQIGLVRSAFDSKNNRVYWAYPSGTSAFNDKVLVLHLDRWIENGYQDGVFSIYTGWRISTFDVWTGEGDKGEMFGGEADGARHNWTYRLDISDEDERGNVSAQATDAITSQFFMGLDPFGRPDMLKKFHSARINLNGPGDTSSTLTIEVDDNRNLFTMLQSYNFHQTLQGDVKLLQLPINRKAIGIKAGLRFLVLDVLSGGTTGPGPWELFEIGLEISPLTTKVRPVA